MEKGKSMMLSSRALPGNFLRAMAVAAASPKIVLAGTAMAAVIKVILTADSSSGEPIFSRKG